MKSKILTLMLCLFLPCAISAQQMTDVFFEYVYSEKMERENCFYATGEIKFQGMTQVIDAPLTDALMLLVILGLMYFIIKIRKGVVR